MPGPLHSLEATPLFVEGLSLISQGEIWEAEPKNILKLDLSGIPGDRHFGASRVVRKYESAELSGLQIANDKQISVVDSADMQTIAEGLEIPIDDIQEKTDTTIEQFLAGQLAANILLGSKQDNTNLYTIAEPGNIMVFSDLDDQVSSAIRLSEYNPPCFKPMRKLRATLDSLGLPYALTTAELGVRFKELGHNRRGWVGSVYSPGSIALGQSVSIYRPLAIPNDITTK